MTNCVSVDVIKEKSVLDALDRFVALSFVLALFATILIVILAVKYITFYMLQEREREKLWKERQHLPRVRREQDIEESESDVNGLWSDEESVDLNATFDRNSDDMEITLDDLTEDLSTNYVGVLPDIEIDNNKKNSYKVLLQIQSVNPEKDLDLQTPDFISTFFQGMSDSNGYCASVNNSNMFIESLSSVIFFRKSAFLSLLTFLFEVLGSSHIITEECVIEFISKYEQKIDESCGEYGLKEALSVSQTVQEIADLVMEDLKENCSPEDIEQIELETIPSILFSLHLDCLKIFSSQLKEITQFNNSYNLMLLECNTDVKRMYIIYKFRVLYLYDSIRNIAGNDSSLNKIISDHMGKLCSILDNAERELNQMLDIKISQFNKEKNEEFEKLNHKQESEVSSLKHELLNSKEKTFNAKIKMFSQYMVALFTSHLEERESLIMKLNEYECSQVKLLFYDLFKSLLNDTSESEEVMFASLQEVCKFTDDNVVAVARQVQHSLKEIKQQYNNMSMEHLKSVTILVEEQSRFTYLFLDYLIKEVSSEFKLVLNAINKAFQVSPFLNEQLTESIVVRIKEKLSVVVFDIVISLTNNFLSLMNIEGKNCKKSLSVLRELKHEIQDVYTSKPGAVNYFPQLMSQFNQCSLDEVHLKYKSITEHLLHDKVISIFEDEIVSLLNNLVLVHYTDAVLVYDKLKMFIESKNDDVSTKKVTSKKYLSRKGSSYTEKSHINELVDLYESHLRMKENKLHETFQQIQSEELQNTFLNQKDKSLTSVNVCKNLLKQAVCISNNTTVERFLKSMFELERYYMMERFMKKITSLEEQETSPVANGLSNKKSKSFTNEDSVQNADKKYKILSDANSVMENSVSGRKIKKKSSSAVIPSPRSKGDSSSSSKHSIMSGVHAKRKNRKVSSM